MIPLTAESASETPICSRAGCVKPALWVLTWRNPMLHTQGRTKAWTACAEHLEFLHDYLDNRRFLLQVDPIGTPHAGGAPR